MRWWLTVAALAATTTGLAAQSWTDRIKRAGDGEIRLAFAAREGLCGDGETYIRDRARGDRTIMEEYGGRSWRDRRPCEEGPVRVALKIRGGAVRRVRTYVGGGWRTTADGPVTDLGTIGVREAVKGFFVLARNTETRPSGDLLVPALFADSVTVWPDLLALAKDREAAQEARKQAVFWLSQAAGEKAAEGLAGLAEDDEEDREVREQAVFALSQLPKDEGVPILIRVARTNKSPDVRRKAMFWLGQSGDPRAVALFEEVLAKP